MKPENKGKSVLLEDGKNNEMSKFCPKWEM